MYQNPNNPPVNWHDTFSKTNLQSSSEEKKDSAKKSSKTVIGDGQNLANSQFDHMKFERLTANSLFLGPSPTQAHKFIPRAVQCINCGNMAKNFLYLEAFLKINTQHKKCSTCSAVLSHLTYWNKNMEEVFKSINNYVQKNSESDQKTAQTSFPFSINTKIRNTSGGDSNTAGVIAASKKKSKKKENKKNKKESTLPNNELISENKTNASVTKIKKVAVPEQTDFAELLNVRNEAVAGGDSKTSTIVKNKQSKKKLKNTKSVAGGDSSDKAVSKTKRRKLNPMDKTTTTKSTGKFETKRGKPKKKKKLFI